MPDDINVEIRPVLVASLVPAARNAREHPPEQIAQLVASIQEFGFLNPVVIGEGGVLIAGHGRVMAAKKLRMKFIPAVDARHLSETQIKAYALADNRIAEGSTWDREVMEADLEALARDGMDMQAFGFAMEDHGLAADPDQIEDVDLGGVDDIFWMSIMGPLRRQAQVIERIQEVMAEVPEIVVTNGAVRADGMGGADRR